MKNMAKTKRSLNEIIEEAIGNIKSDRATAEMLLTDLVISMKSSGDEAHITAGNIATSYLETLQRSNEQLVKVAAIIQKNEGNTNSGLSDSEKDNIFDMIREK
jgi:hypothetical protein